MAGLFWSTWSGIVGESSTPMGALMGDDAAFLHFSSELWPVGLWS